MAAEIKHVYGNALRIAIPLNVITTELIEGRVTVVDSPLTPVGDVTICLISSVGNRISRKATVNGTTALVDLGCSTPVGTYSIEVYCKDGYDNNMRYSQHSAVKVVNSTAEAGITPGVEFDAVKKELSAHIFWLGGGGTALTADDIAEWAKQPEKPVYTASEVGALPSDTAIPERTSELVNDSGFATTSYVDENSGCKTIIYGSVEEVAQDTSQAAGTHGMVIADRDTFVYVWDGMYWNELPTRIGVNELIRDSIDMPIDYSPKLPVNGGNKSVTTDKVCVIANRTVSCNIQCTGSADASAFCEFVIYVDCTTSDKTISWSNAINWHNNAPDFTSGAIYEISIVRVGEKYFGEYIEYESASAFQGVSRNQ